MSTITSSQTPSNSEKFKPNTKYAQTNLQLFNQLRSEGYSDSELSCIFNAYKVVVSLYTGWFRPSGKTFIAHLVGTASILASLRLPAKVVAAGLLHAAYSSGSFDNTSQKGITPAKRQWLIHAVGSEVEEYITKYQVLKWNKNNNISVICQGLDSLEPIEREVLLIRLANELEEYQDLGLLYCPKEKQKRYSDRHHQMVEMAEKLGFPILAAEFKKAKAEMDSATIPQELCYCDEKKSSFFIPSPRQKLTLSKIKRAIVPRLKKLIPHK
jgi:(p)ppGpp synthase/HD superfamily hydrolase